MLQSTTLPNVYLWSQAGGDLSRNAYLVRTESGNAVIDPIGLDERDGNKLAEVGGVAAIVVLTPDRAPDANALAQSFNAPTIINAQQGEEILSGLRTLTLRDQPAGSTFAVLYGDEDAIFCGDALIGSPAGGLSLRDAQAYADMPRAVLKLRSLLRVDPRAILPSRGYPIFREAYDVLYRLLYACAGAEVHRINLEELEFIERRPERPDEPPLYQCYDAEVGLQIGARKLGYRVSTIDPGKRFCPLHSHAREEELFFVLEGEPSVRTSSETLRCRKGDFIAFPVGELGAHQLLNDSAAPATVLLLGRTEEMEACYYPDSDKLLVEMETPFLHGSRGTIVRASPELDYFDGEA